MRGVQIAAYAYLDVFLEGLHELIALFACPEELLASQGLPTCGGAGHVACTGSACHHWV